MMRIGICGGTFDPFHRGHLEAVLAVRGVMEWDRIVYVPAHRQPFKLDQASTSGYHRFAMAVLATEDRDELYVSPRELERGDVSFTVDTLDQLRAEHPDATIDWIIGDDNLSQLEQWKSLPRIFELANFAVLTRISGESASSLVPAAHRYRVSAPRTRGNHGAIVFAENPTVPVSSTEVRRRVRAGEPIDAFVDRRVRRYIEHNRLYQGDHP
jgi:nicotinate-nucleotide adenylyltransferase